ncbi:MAG TPA: hypothetical protein VF658_20995 [Pyrinomonadaceae bacterium]|jgi:hypothetical protein
MSRPLTLRIMVLLLTISLIPVSSAQTTWQQVTDREAGFTISFPGQPTYQATADPATGLQTEIYKFFYSGRLLQITFALLPKSVRNRAEFGRVYSEFTQLVVPSSGILLRQQKLPDGGRQYDTVADTKDGTIYGRTRLYLRNGRYYAIAFEMYAQNRIDEREAERFLSSFNFLDALSKRQVPAYDNFPTKSTVGRSDRAKWYTFKAPSSDFLVEFPGKPSYQLDSSSETSVPFHRYYYFYGENIFQVSYREDPEASTRPEQVILKALRIYTSHRGGWRVLRQVQLPDGGYQVESRGTSDGVPVYSQTRLYVRSTRLYYVTALTQNLVGPNKDDVLRFFESFRFL